MARIKNPILFSNHFNIDKSVFAKVGFVDPFLNVDTQLFIDPVLLSKSRFKEISNKGYQGFRTHFNNFIRLLDMSESENDAAWVAARRLLDLREPPQTGLGYGGSSRSGNSRPNELRDAIMRTAKDIIKLGYKDPEMISLMGFFEKNVGPDTISDFTTRVIMVDLAILTSTFCNKHKVPMNKVNSLDGIELPHYKGKPVLLVPKDIVRDLPIANDWSDIESAALQNQEIRARVNALLAGIAQPTISEKKEALKSAAMESFNSFDHFVKAVKDNVVSYDPKKDSLAYYKIREILKSDLQQFKQETSFDINSNPEALYSFVIEVVKHFQHHVENGNLWEELWVENKPKKERASQLIFFALADCFCIANNVDVSPEANMGGGPIDFKFSKGYNARVLVELKLSKGTVRHGYEKQLEIYKNASRTNYGVFVIINVGGLGVKLKQIERIRQSRLNNGEKASEIIVIDALKKKSASKR